MLSQLKKWKKIINCENRDDKKQDHISTNMIYIYPYLAELNILCQKID